MMTKRKRSITSSKSPPGLYIAANANPVIIIAMKTTRITTSLILNSFSSTVDINFPSSRLFKSKATITTANNASGIAMSRVGIESRIISDSFMPLAKN